MLHHVLSESFCVILMSVPCCSDTQGNSFFISFIFLCNFGIPGIIHSKYIKCSILTAYLPTYIHISDSDPSKDINSIIKKKKKKSLPTLLKSQMRSCSKLQIRIQSVLLKYFILIIQLIVIITCCGLLNQMLYLYNETTANTFYH